MALGERGPAPYAPGVAVVDVIRFARDRGLPVPVDTEKLDKIGLKDSIGRRTLRALEMLDLIDAEGQPTETFEKIRLAPSDQYKAILAEWFREAYKPILTYVDPGSDVEKIFDQFRPYEPLGMRERMVSLFLHLAVEAGLINERPKKPRASKAASPRATRTVKPKDKTPPAKPAEDAVAEKLVVSSRASNGELPTDAKERYLQLLIALAEKQDAPDAALLDRIERVLLGVSAKGEAS